MGEINLAVQLFRLVVVVALVLLVLSRFRGGRPPRPMHPSPANDGFLLRRKRKIMN